MPADNICALTLEELAGLIREKEVSPLEVTDAVLGRIQQINPSVNAFTTVCSVEARRAAASAEAEILRGQYRGPLHGVPVGVKDVYDTAGIRTTYGSPMFRDHVPERDAFVVARLRQAGAVIVGKTATHELALGMTTNNFFFGPTRNPWNLERVPGGSSGGSGAAIAADMCPATIGSDTGGSIRFPSVWCGCVGLKPTVGLVSSRGEMGHWGSSISVPGPIAKTVRDAAIVLQAVAGYEPADPWSVRRPIPAYSNDIGGGIAGLRVGVSRDFFAVPVQAAVRAAYDAALAALAGLGAEIVEVRMPHHERAVTTVFVVMGSELASWYRHLEATGRSQYGPETRPLINLATGFGVDDLVRAEADRRRIRRDYREAFASVEAIVLPTAPVVAPRIGEEQIEIDGRQEMISQICAAFTTPANLAALPAVAVPAGLSPEGLPVGIQIVAPPFEEGRALRVAESFTAAAPAIRRLRSPMAA